MPNWHKHYIDKDTHLHKPEMLASVGPIMQVEVNLPQPLIEFLSSQNKAIPAPAAGMALIDTGATRSCVNESTLQNLGINPIGIVSVGTAAGAIQRPLFPARLEFPEFKLIVDLSAVIGVSLLDQAIDGTPLLALVGRDILRHSDFVYSGTGGFFTLSV